MIRPIKIKLNRHQSPYFPIKASYTINGVKYSDVYEDTDQARRYLENRFLYVSFDDQTGEEVSNG